MSGERILVVDDEANIVSLVRLYLEQDGFRVEAASDGARAMEMIQARTPALVILDIMLPELDGFEVCRRTRSISEVPIIMLTARDDDYLTKPFNPRELVARVKAILRRVEGKPPGGQSPLHVGDVTIDPARREVTIAGKPVALRAKEFELLQTLAEHRGLVLTREQLLNLVWGYDFFGQTRTVDVHVAHLRKLLAGSRVSIETI